MKLHKKIKKLTKLLKQLNELTLRITALIGSILMLIELLTE